MNGGLYGYPEGISNKNGLLSLPRIKDIKSNILAKTYTGWSGNSLLSDLGMYKGISTGGNVQNIVKKIESNAIFYSGTGSNPAANIRINDNIRVFPQLSFSFWQYTTTSSFGGAFGSWDSNSISSGQLFFFNATGNYPNAYQFLVAYNGGSNSSVTAPNVLLNTWQHFICTWDLQNQRMLLYLNGQLVSSATIPVTAVMNSGADIFSLGGYAISDNTITNFRGYLEQVLVVQGILTEEEISYLYNYGQGNKFSLVENFTEDAQNVIAAIESTGTILNSTQKTAITNRIMNAKLDGVWSKWVAYYGFVGGTAASHAINWKNPSLYQITWNGTITHDSNGVKGNGSTGYGDTGINASSILTFSATGYGVYYTEAKTPATSVDVGAVSGGNSSQLYILDETTDTAYFEIGNSFIGAANNGAKQYLSGNKIGNAVALYRNGSIISTGTISGEASPNLNIFIGARNLNGSPSLYSSARFGSVCLNTSLTSSEESANYISELAFQTALGRN